MRGPQGTLGLNPASHGDGPIATSLSPWHLPVEDDLVHALDQISLLPLLKDPFSGDHLGFSGTLSHIDRSEGAVRSDVMAYLNWICDRPILKILSDAIASKLLLNEGFGPFKARDNSCMRFHQDSAASSAIWYW
ncbi:hypothetical protein BDV06DRAFT_197620 [Aspergillus oleicola]